MTFAADQIDPSTFRVNVNADLRTTLEDVKELIRQTAKTSGQYVFLHYDETKEQLHIVSRERDLFESDLMQCPQAADERFEFTCKSPRKLPSMVAKPNGEVIVSKPSLCDTCQWKVHKASTGSCLSKQYTPGLGIIR